MTELTKPLHGQSGSFFVNGGKRREGMLLLYPDKLDGAGLRAGRPGATSSIPVHGGLPAEHWGGISATLMWSEEPWLGGQGSGSGM